MLTRIKKVGLANGVTSSGKSYTLSEMIQESYTVSYKAKKMKNPMLVNLTEAHLMNVKTCPTDLQKLSEDLDVLQGLVKLGKDSKLVDVDETKVSKKSRKNTSSKVKGVTKVKESLSWKTCKSSLNEGLKNFRNSAKSKIFYKELDKFNKSIASGKSFTMTEAVNLYKAANSCLTHLTVELERNPSFLETYSACTKLLTRDNNKLLESLQSNKIPGRALLENFVSFTNILLECDTNDNLDKEVYQEEPINEDDDMLAVDDKDVLEEDLEAPAEEAPAEDPQEDVEDNVPVDLTAEEIKILKSILSKISSLDEDEDVVPDEEVVPDMDDEETDDIDSEDYEDVPSEEEEVVEEDEDLEEPEYSEEEEVVEEDEEEVPSDSEDVAEDPEEEYSDEEIPVEEDEVLDDEYEEEPYNEEIPDEDDIEEDLEEPEYSEEEEVVEEDEEDVPSKSFEDKLLGLKKSVDEVLSDLPDEDEESLEESEEEIPDEDILEESDEEDEEDLDTEINEAVRNRIKKFFKQSL